ncbi:Hydrogenase maturation protease delta subunit,HyaD-like [Caloramator australicus RC3]|uniref:Hydrogenase maturation protease delta subunit,HyaD-like n=3 Tax=Caloramator TaxID=44258 RepID=I7KW38_9CLOT|nr:Hydrogenase maturation protease delta subunit,HyaD-like [Caloramator australicus RC3]
MGDDGVSVEVLKIIKKELEENNIKIFAIETDINSLFSIIEEDDVVIFVDAMISSGKVGEVKAFKPNLPEQNEFFCHVYFPWNIISKMAKEIYIIGIEVEDIDFKIGLSKKLQDEIYFIANKTLFLITNILTNLNYKV